MRSTNIALAFLLFSTVSGRAQEPSAPTAQDRAAAELVALLRLDQVTRSSIESMTEAMMSQNPAFAEIEDVFVEFLDEFMSWDDLRPEYVRLYGSVYTEDEIHELIAFYRTPVGQKSVDLMPRLMREGAEIGQRMIQPHLPELQRRIQARIRGDSPR